MAINYKLEDVNKLKDRAVFFDANILIYLFWPTGQYRFEENYASAFRNLLRQKNKMFVDFLIISEVINRVIRIEHQKINPNQKFKDFRNSQEGQDALNDIYLIVKQDVLNQFEVVGKVFDKQDIESKLIIDELDFVDKAIIELCKEHNLVLLTNDRDFKNADLDILTGNRIILD